MDVVKEWLGSQTRKSRIKDALCFFRRCFYSLQFFSFGIHTFVHTIERCWMRRWELGGWFLFNYLQALPWVFFATHQWLSSKRQTQTLMGLQESNSFQHDTSWLFIVVSSMSFFVKLLISFQEFSDFSVSFIRSLFEQGPQQLWPGCRVMFMYLSYSYASPTILAFYIFPVFLVLLIGYCFFLCCWWSFQTLVGGWWETVLLLKGG